MNLLLRRFLFTCIALCLCVVSGCDQEETIQSSDGDSSEFTQLKSYDADDLSQFSVDEIVADFLDIAFPESFDSLVKWNEPIRIPFQNVAGPGSQFPFVGSAIEVQVEHLIPEIASLTGLDISETDLFPSGPGKEVDAGNLRVGVIPHYIFKRSQQADVRMTHIMRSLDVRFTPGVPSQLEGGIVTAGPYVGYCYIHPSHTEAMQRMLASECLVRALGLLNPSRLTHNALVSYWNRPNAFLKLNEDHELPPKFSEYEQNLSEEYGPNWFRSELSAYDKLLLEILYDSVLEPGMTREEVKDILPDIVRAHFIEAFEQMEKE